MPRFSSPLLAQLLMQMRFATEHQRKKQLEAAQALLKLVKPETDYPFEFICFQITGYRPKGSSAQEIMPGTDLSNDLRVFISRLSNLAAEQAQASGQNVFSIEQLAKKLHVSAKTINRWRSRGLVAKKYIFQDGTKRYGFTQGSIEEFSKLNPKLVSKAQNFSHLLPKQRNQIVKRAIELSASNSSRRKIIEIIAKETSRVPETIRYTLVNYEKKQGKSIFKKRSAVLHASDAANICKLYQQGKSIPEIMSAFGRSKSSIYRIINTRRATELLSQRIEFISSDEFLNDTAAKTILGPKESEPSVPVPADVPSSGFDFNNYLESIKHKPLLTREQEIELFRRYNFLKYMACLERTKINLGSVSSRQIKIIEQYLSDAQQIQKRIIESNLRLVVSIASKHSAAGSSLAELVSEGNLSLLRAVEKFDYTRGFRFSTYASWAIAKDFARKIPAEVARPDRAGGDEFSNVQKDMRKSGIAGIAAIEKAGKSLEQIMKDNLDEREQYIIKQHFALTGSVLKKKGASLAHIGTELGLSKERVRQLELGALQKLRHLMSPEEFELLTG